MMPSSGSRTNRIAFWALAAWLIAGPAAAQAPSPNLLLFDVPKPVAALDFDDGEGQARSLADFKGKVVLLNIWATWCIPCRKEMPALDRLQAILGGPDFEVVPVSIDRGGRDTVAKFYAEAGIRNLAMYIDASGQAVRTLGAVGLPTTLIINRGGDESTGSSVRSRGTRLRSLNSCNIPSCSRTTRLEASIDRSTHSPGRGITTQPARCSAHSDG